MTHASNFKGRASDWLSGHLNDNLCHAINWEAAYLLSEDNKGSCFVKKCTSKLTQHRPSKEESEKFMVFPTKNTVNPVILPRDPDLNMVRDSKRPLIQGTHISRVKGVLSANGVHIRGDRPDRAKSVRGSKRFGIYGTTDWQTGLDYCSLDKFLVLTLILADRDVHLGTGKNPNYVMKEHWIKTIGVIVVDTKLRPQGGLFADKSIDLEKVILYSPIPYLPECTEWNLIPRSTWERFRQRKQLQSQSRSRKLRSRSRSRGRSTQRSRSLSYRRIS